MNTGDKLEWEKGLKVEVLMSKELGRLMKRRNATTLVKMRTLKSGTLLTWFAPSHPPLVGAVVLLLKATVKDIVRSERAGPGFSEGEPEVILNRLRWALPKSPPYTRARAR